jgi:CDP-glucose 4,6-dehydratase
MKISNFRMLKDLKGPVLITGHTGFKGTWMTLLLQNIGFNVIGYSLNPEKDSLFNLAKRKGKIDEAFEDIRDRKKLEKFIKKHKPSLIYHLAAQPLVIDSYSNPYETFEINSIGTANILDIALRIDSVKFIGVVTTDKVYENKELGNRFKEGDALAGSDPYSESKVAAEAAVRTWQKISNIENGPKIVSLRAGNVIGGGDLSKNRLTADVVRAIKSDTELKKKMNSVTSNAQSTVKTSGGDPLIADTIVDLNPSLQANLFRDDVTQWIRSLGKFPRMTNRIPKLMPLSDILPTDDENAKSALVWLPRKLALEYASEVFNSDPEAASSFRTVECKPPDRKSVV